jgi:DNA polymerase-3 subunit delta'
LKVLEEPPDDTVVILTSSEPQALLPTIRSRLVPLRVGRVGDSVVRAFLEREVDPAPEGDDLETRTLLAEGSIGRAVWSDEAGDDARRAAVSLLAAIQGGPDAWGRAALAQAPWSARGDFSSTLDALALLLREGMVERADTGRDVGGWLQALERVEEIRTEAQGNANPQLALAVLGSDLEQLL